MNTCGDVSICENGTVYVKSFEGEKFHDFHKTAKVLFVFATEQTTACVKQVL